MISISRSLSIFFERTTYYATKKNEDESAAKNNVENSAPQETSAGTMSPDNNVRTSVLSVLFSEQVLWEQEQVQAPDEAPRAYATKPAGDFDVNNWDFDGSMHYIGRDFDVNYYRDKTAPQNAAVVYAEVLDRETGAREYHRIDVNEIDPENASPMESHALLSFGANFFCGVDKDIVRLDLAQAADKFTGTTDMLPYMETANYSAEEFRTTRANLLEQDKALADAYKKALGETTDPEMRETLDTLLHGCEHRAAVYSKYPGGVDDEDFVPNFLKTAEDRSRDVEEAAKNGEDIMEKFLALKKANTSAFAKKDSFGDESWQSWMDLI